MRVTGALKHAAFRLTVAATWFTLCGAAVAQRTSAAGTASPSISPSEEGTSVLSWSGDLAILDRDTAYRNHSYAGGFALQLVTRRKTWPVMLGVAGGLLFFLPTSSPGPDILQTNAAGDVVLATSRVHRNIEVGHCEFVVRAQPWWGVIRPFAEVALGVAVLWHTSSLHEFDGDRVTGRDEQTRFTFLYGASLGVDWRILSSGPTPRGTVDVVLTTGVKRLYTGPMERPRYIADVTAEPEVASLGTALAMWIPFVAVALSFDSRPGAYTIPTASLSRASRSDVR